MYTIEPLTEREFRTLCWLSDHGYDATILNRLVVEQQNDGTYHFEPIPEHVAWDIQAEFDANPEAFLACCGSAGLSDKLFDFLNSII